MLSHTLKIEVGKNFMLLSLLCSPSQVKSSPLFYIALFTIQIVQLHSDDMKIIQHRSILLNIKFPQLSKQKPRQQWQGTKTPSGD